MTTNGYYSLGRRVSLSGGRIISEVVLKVDDMAVKYEQLKAFAENHRKTFCKMREMCVDFASDKRWWNFSCFHCPRLSQPEDYFSDAAECELDSFRCMKLLGEIFPEDFGKKAKRELY